MKRRDRRELQREKKDGESKNCREGERKRERKKRN